MHAALLTMVLAAAPGNVLTFWWFDGLHPGPEPQTCYAPRFGPYPGATPRHMHRYPAFHGMYYRRPYNYRNVFDYPWHAGLHEPTSLFSYNVDPPSTDPYEHALPGQHPAYPPGYAPPGYAPGGYVAPEQVPPGHPQPAPQPHPAWPGQPTTQLPGAAPAGAGYPPVDAGRRTAALPYPVVAPRVQVYPQGNPPCYPQPYAGSARSWTAAAPHPAAVYPQVYAPRASQTPAAPTRDMQSPQSDLRLW